jgi:ABC-2 type transport system permease protein
MKNYVVFLKKELFESIKTHKLLIMGAAFLFFGMLSPLTARFTPEIIRWAMASDPSMAGMDLSGLMTEPVAFDSWAQFYGNVGLMGFIALVIVFSGMLSSELSRGTLTIVLSKGLSRTAVILSKLTSAVLIWTASFAASFLTAWGYTAYMFPGESVPNLFFAMFCLWVFGVFLLALTALAATLTDKGFVCMIVVGMAAVVLNIVNIIPAAGKYNPVSLSSASMLLLTDDFMPRSFYPALAFAGIGTAAFTAFAVIIFNKNKKKARKKTVVLMCAVIACMALTIFIGREI